MRFSFFIFVVCMLMSAFVDVFLSNSYAVLKTETNEIDKELNVLKGQFVKLKMRTEKLKSFSRLESISRRYSMSYMNIPTFVYSLNYTTKK